MNVRGFDSKSKSLNSILGTLRPDVVTLNETHYKHNRKVKIKGYKTFQKNRAYKSGGGIATLVDNKHKNKTVLVSKGSDNEFVVTRHSQFAVPINVINLYGECESRSKVEDIEDRWFNVVSEINKLGTLRKLY